MPDEIGYLDQETAEYQIIQGENIGPAFLGHVSEAGRTIGFLIERIENARHATIDDHVACAKALEKVYGDVNKHSFLIGEVDGSAMLIGSDGLRLSDGVEELRREMKSPVGELNDTSGKGGCMVLGN
jgi:hypothetical protein